MASETPRNQDRRLPNIATRSSRLHNRRVSLINQDHSISLRPSDIRCQLFNTKVIEEEEEPRVSRKKFKMTDTQATPPKISTLDLMPGDQDQKHLLRFYPKFQLVKLARPSFTQTVCISTCLLRQSAPAASS